MKEEDFSKLKPGKILLIPSTVKIDTPVTRENINSFSPKDIRSLPGLAIVFDSAGWEKAAKEKSLGTQVHLFLPGSEDFTKTPCFISIPKDNLLRAMIIDEQQIPDFLAILEETTQYINGKSKYHGYLQYLRRFIPIFLSFQKNRRRFQEEAKSGLASEEIKFLFDILTLGIPIFEHQS